MITVRYIGKNKMILLEKEGDTFFNTKERTRQSVESLCEKYGQPIRINFANGKIMGMSWDEEEINNKCDTEVCSEFLGR